MPANWPPATAPPWPPAGYEQLEASDQTTLSVIISELQGGGWTMVPPTSAENTQFFSGVRCSHDHTQITGRMIVSPDGTRYPFAYCRQAGHREFLVLWFPYFMGPGSAD